MPYDKYTITFGHQNTSDCLLTYSSARTIQLGVYSLPHSHLLHTLTKGTTTVYRGWSSIIIDKKEGVTFEVGKKWPVK